MVPGFIAEANRLGAGSIVKYTVLSSAATHVLSDKPCIFYGVIVTVGGAGSTVTVYDNASAASGTLLLPATASTTANTKLGVIPDGIGVITKNGLVVVLAATAPTVLVLWA
jgi:hypothetical protein